MDGWMDGQIDILIGDTDIEIDTEADIDKQIWIKSLIVSLQNPN